MSETRVHLFWQPYSLTSTPSTDVDHQQGSEDSDASQTQGERAQQVVCVVLCLARADAHTETPMHFHTHTYIQPPHLLFELLIDTVLLVNLILLIVAQRFCPMLLRNASPREPCSLEVEATFMFTPILRPTLASKPNYFSSRQHSQLFSHLVTHSQTQTHVHALHF